MTHEEEILERLDRIEHLLRSLWEDPQLDRIEDHVRHIRYGETGQPSDYAQARELARLESAFQQQNWAPAGGQSPEWAKPAPASPADPQARRTDRA
jgi:hypothetical protein